MAGGGAGRSYNFLPSGLVNQLNASDADVVHLHWINGEMVRLEQLAKIKAPIVWTFHDMWPFCGAENYSNEFRYVTGYQRSEFNSDGQSTDNRERITDNCRSKSDLDRGVFCRKKKAWRSLDLHIVCVSTWLLACVRESALFKNTSAIAIPNCLDTDVFKPCGQKLQVRQKYNIPLQKKVILYGSSDLFHPRKGGDLMKAALSKIQNKEECCLIIFGADHFDAFADSAGELQTICVGKIVGDQNLADLYNCADLVCVPSRQETFGQTASEPLACGIPVVAFNTTGLTDVVDHKINGYLAVPFDTNDFAQGIEWILQQADPDALSRSARQKAERCFVQGKVAAQYIDVYKKALSVHH
jgi:glycosyltransferase involved in cell wall biosynthesis